MPFFSVPDSDETPDTDDQDDLRTAPWIAGIVPLEVVVARSDRAAVVLKRVAAYREGFELSVSAVLRPGSVTNDGRRADLWGLRRGRSVPPETLRLGLVWPDGGRATNLDDWARNWAADPEPEAPYGLEEKGGSGDQHELSNDYWAWPLPTGGVLQLVVEWPAYGIGETVLEIDGDLIAQAAQRASPVFEEDADAPSHYSRAAYLAHLHND